jgi:L-ascorbate metabolism protein UlaG (beta-lactamase superfamily)
MTLSRRARRIAPALMLFGLMPLVLADGQTTAPGAVRSGSALVAEIRAQNSGVAVWWLGHDSWLIKAGGQVIGIDLVAEEPQKMAPPPLTAIELATIVDVSFVTHGHRDHFHRYTSTVLAEQGKNMFVIPRSTVAIAAELKLPEARVRVATPREPFDLGGIHVRPIRAVHGNGRFAVYEQASLEDCGYVLTIGGKTFLQPGDSVLLEDQLFVGHVNVLFFSPTEHNTYIEPSVVLINELEPDYILPQHRDTYTVTPEKRFWTQGYAREVEVLLSKALRQRYHILRPGERLMIE